MILVPIPLNKSSAMTTVLLNQSKRFINVLLNQSKGFINVLLNQSKRFIKVLLWAVVGLMDRALDLKPEVIQGCGFKSRLRQEVHNCSPGAAQSAVHCSKCVHLDGLNAENTFHSSLYSV